MEKRKVKKFRPKGVKVNKFRLRKAIHSKFNSTEAMHLRSSSKVLVNAKYKASYLRYSHTSQAQALSRRSILTQTKAKLTWLSEGRGENLSGTRAIDQSVRERLSHRKKAHTTTSERQKGHQWTCYELGKVCNVWSTIAAKGGERIKIAIIF